MDSTIGAREIPPISIFSIISSLLAPVAVEDIQRIIAKLTKKNIGILITDHNVQETLAITDRTYLMFEGSILKAGEPEVLASDEMVRKVYLGQNFELRKKKLEF